MCYNVICTSVYLPDALALERGSTGRNGFDRHGKHTRMQVSTYLGTQGWSYKSWVGTFYPERTPASRYLSEYSRRFRAVEIDSTAYGTPRLENVQQWYNLTPEDFRFTAKFPQVITHDKMLKDAEQDTAHFLATMRVLGEKLGPLLLQFPYQFKPDQLEILGDFLAALPKDFRYAVEVRHRGWLNDTFFGLLEEHNVAFALTDYAYMPRLERLTTDFTYVRWLGSRKDVPDNQYARVRIQREAELDHWSHTIARFMDQGTTVWGFANNHYQGHSPSTINALMERLGLQERFVVHRRISSGKKSASERRNSQRVSATYRIAYECYSARGIKIDEGPARTVDISGRGALIEVPRPVDLDSSVVLLVMAPFHMLMVKGSVVHSRRVQNGQFHVGVRLTEVVEGSWDVLNSILKERKAEIADEGP